MVLLKMATQLTSTLVVQLDGEEFEGGQAEGYDLEIGSGSFIPGFEEQLEGMKVDEEKDVVVTFPEEYHAEELAGKEATLKQKLTKLNLKKFQN